MKEIIFTLIFVSLFFSCSTQSKALNNKEYSKGIVYVLPGKVQKLLLEKSIKEQNVYFSLEKIEDFKFRIFLGKYEFADNWVANTNRYVSIGGKLYTLTFDLDEYFANTETAAEFLKDQDAGIYKRTQKSIVRENVYHIDFDLKGEILYEGFNN